MTVTLCFVIFYFFEICFVISRLIMWFQDWFCDFEIFFVILNFVMWFWNGFVILIFSCVFSKFTHVNQKSESVTVMWFSKSWRVIWTWTVTLLSSSEYVLVLYWFLHEFTYKNSQKLASNQFLSKYVNSCRKQYSTFKVLQKFF